MSKYKALGAVLVPGKAGKSLASPFVTKLDGRTWEVLDIPIAEQGRSTPGSESWSH